VLSEAGNPLPRHGEGKGEGLVDHQALNISNLPDSTSFLMDSIKLSGAA